MAESHEDTCRKNLMVSIGEELTIGCAQCIDRRTQKKTDAEYNRKQQQKQYRRDLTQPNDPAFAKAYPEKFRELYGDDMYRKYG